MRDGGLLQHLSVAGIIWFDKTGTLTVGRPEVTRTFGCTGKALAFAAAIERECTHPLATCILAEADRRGLQLPSLDAPAAMVVGGVEGVVEGHRVRIGNLDLMRRNGVQLDEQAMEFVAQVEFDGNSPVLIAIDSQLSTILSVSDPLRADAAALIQELSDRGWKVGILSGDHQEVVSHIAQRLGVEAAAARVL